MTCWTKDSVSGALIHDSCSGLRYFVIGASRSSFFLGELDYC